MTLDLLDADELLRIALDAMNEARDADALVALKTLVEREPAHAMGRYLLAAQHAQMGLMDKAESGFREVVRQAPDFAIARFQLGQLLLTKGELTEANSMLAPLAGQSDSIGRYAQALAALSMEDAAGAVASLEAGLELPQAIPALASDMRRLLDTLQANAGQVSALDATPMFLTGYGQATRDD